MGPTGLRSRHLPGHSHLQTVGVQGPFLPLFPFSEFEDPGSWLVAASSIFNANMGVLFIPLSLDTPLPVMGSTGVIPDSSASTSLLQGALG